MPEGVILFDRAYFDSAEWLNQKNAADGFGRGAAWLDLLALANQKATTMEIRGLRIPIERGQCGRSKLALAQRWGYSQGKAAMLLAYWEKTGRIKVESGNDTTIISILNFDDWQTALSGMVCEQIGNRNANRLGTDREQTETEKDKERESTVPRGIGEGVPPAEIPDDETIRKFCSEWPGDMARGIPSGIPEMWWSGWVASRLQDEKKWPRDWQRVLVLAFRGDFLNRHPKALPQTTPVNGSAGRVSEKNGGGVSVAQAVFKLDAKIKELTVQREAFEDTQPDLVEKLTAELDQLQAQRRELAA